MKRVKYIYHCTERENLKDILELGLIPGAVEGIPGGLEVPGVVWLDSQYQGLRRWLNKYHPNDWVTLGIDSTYLDRDKLTRARWYIVYFKNRRERSTWYTYRGNIPPEAIHVVGSKRK